MISITLGYEMAVCWIDGSRIDGSRVRQPEWPWRLAEPHCAAVSCFRDSFEDSQWPWQRLLSPLMDDLIHPKLLLFPIAETHPKHIAERWWCAINATTLICIWMRFAVRKIKGPSINYDCVNRVGMACKFRNAACKSRIQQTERFNCRFEFIAPVAWRMPLAGRFKHIILLGHWLLFSLVLMNWWDSGRLPMLVAGRLGRWRAERRRRRRRRRRLKWLMANIYFSFLGG